MQKSIRIGTRPSLLALKQVKEIERKLPGIRFEVVSIMTKGDKDKETSLLDMEKTDFFTREIEDALLRGEIDAAIHSAKDLEDTTPKGLMTACVTKSISPFESLVSNGNLKLGELPSGAFIGISSRRRKKGVKKFRKDLNIKHIRGNVNERIDKLDGTEFDAIVVAHAALLRLGCESQVAEIISPDVIEPHPLQGKLAVQVRSDRHDIIEIFRGINET